MEDFPWDDLRSLVYSAASSNPLLTKEVLFRALLLPSLDDDKTSLLCKGIRLAGGDAETLPSLVSLIGQLCGSPQSPEVQLACIRELAAVDLQSLPAVSNSRASCVSY
jgi:hypothetical protein